MFYLGEVSQATNAFGQFSLFNHFYAFVGDWFLSSVTCGVSFCIYFLFFFSSFFLIFHGMR